MKQYEKLFTVEDIANMTMLTTRTIRNYLKDGLLKGRKIGGQWRFTEQDIEELFENSNIEAEIKDIRRQEVMDFIDGINTDMEGDIQLCTIADYYCEDLNLAKEISTRFENLMSDHTDTTQRKYFYDYIEKEHKARYTFFGSPKMIQTAVTVLEVEWNRLHNSLDKFTNKGY